MNSQLGLFDWLSFFGSFALVLGLIAALFWALSRLNGRMPGKPEERSMAVAAVLPIGPRQRLMLVRVRDREVLVAVSIQQISCLGNWPAPQPDAPSQVAPSEPANPSDNVITGAALKRLLGRIEESK